MASAGDSSTTEGKRSSKSVEETPPPVEVLELSPNEWARYHASFDTTPQMVIGALDADRVYTRDEAQSAIHT